MTGFGLVEDGRSIDTILEEQRFGEALRTSDAS
jgi:hypothetical protein